MLISIVRLNDLAFVNCKSVIKAYGKDVRA